MPARSARCFPGIVATTPSIRRSFLNLRMPDRSRIVRTWWFRTNRELAWMMTDIFEFGLLPARFSSTGAMYVRLTRFTPDRCALTPGLWLFELAASGTLTTSAATRAVTKPRPPLPQSALERVSSPRFPPVPHNALDRSSFRLPLSVRTFRSPFRALDAGRNDCPEQRLKARLRCKTRRNVRGCGSRLHPPAGGDGRKVPSCEGSSSRGGGSFRGGWLFECRCRLR